MRTKKEIKEVKQGNYRYIEGYISENARKAYTKGMFPISKITRQLLDEYNFNYSINFFKWLYHKEYINPSERHHTSPTYNLTAFYSPKAIASNRKITYRNIFNKE